jgi:8-oxo-dGTP diphosphatase
MEAVDKLNNKKETINKIGDRSDKILGEYNQVVHVWIINDKNEFLIQKRSLNKKVFPGMWSQTGGGVDAGETSLQGALRETKEELGIEIPKDNIEFMLSFKRKFNYLDAWLVRMNIDLADITIQKEEVSEVKWVNKETLIKMHDNGELAPSIDIYFNMFLDLLEYPY